MSAPSSQPDADTLAAEIRETRGEASGTLSEVKERVAPERLMDQATETVREATVGRVETMVDDVSTQAQQAGSGLVQTIRDNPIPAAMAGIGLYLLWQRFQSGSSGDGVRYGNHIRSRGEGWRERVGQTAGGATSSAREGADQVAHEAGRMASEAGSMASDRASQVRDQAVGMQSQAGRIIEENPLAAALVAVGVGAAIGAVIPPTRQERQALGPVAQQVSEAASETMETVEQRATEAVGQAKRQVDQAARS